VALLAGLPVSVPGMTLPRHCASGLQAIAIATHQIQNEDAEIIVAGGVESITMLRSNLNVLNVNGGAISIGHLYGMTGSRVAGHILRELRRRKQPRGSSPGAWAAG
jgi:acetyl-CoA acetyltransferase